MRLIGSVDREDRARRLSAYLYSRGIDNRCEVSSDAEIGKKSYAVWIVDEDKITVAQEILAEFQKEPSHPKFDSEERGRGEEKEWNGQGMPFAPKPRGTPVSFLILFVCCAIFFLNGVQEASLGAVSPMTPIVSALLYDTPSETAGGVYWKGIGDWIFSLLTQTDFLLGEGTLFAKVRQGEVWRLFSPSILHTQFLHILFNMIWLWILSRPVEQRIGSVRLALFTLIAGIGSNTLQYLVSGPFFLGYSGVALALAGLVWARQKRAPWEGYALHRTTFWFLMFFVGAMFALSAVSFMFALFFGKGFAPNIANTAHISGVFIGLFLGRFSLFAQRVKR